jgi:hypothetical protein
VNHEANPVPECQGFLDSYNGLQKWQIVGFTSAGVFAAAWLGLILTETSSSPETDRSLANARSWTCSPARGLQGVACSLTM